LNFYLKLFFFFLILIWVLGIFVEVLIPHFNYLAFLYPYLDIIYSHVCHQQPEKTLSISGHSLLVCSRCTGIYIGSLVSAFILLFVPFIKVSNTKYLILASVPMFVDVILYSIGVYTYSKTIALFSGSLFGIAGIIYIYKGLQILLAKKREEET